MPKTSNKDERKFTCTACGLYQNCISKRMKPTGSFKKGIMFIGESPSEMDDRLGAPFQGKTGMLLQRTCRKLGINLFEDCLVLNAVACRPSYPSGNNRVPTNKEIDCCRRLVLQAVEEYKPKLIILLGGSAVYSLIGNRWKRDLGTISKWRGWTIPDQDFQTWICPTFHPSYIERSDTGVEQVVWEQDLKQAFTLLETAEYQNSPYPLHPFPVYKEPRIEVIEDLHILDNIRNNEVAFDYETTGLKPHAVGHRIICCAVAPSEDHAYVFIMPKTKEERKPFIDLLQDEKIGKIAQNMKFEHSWSEVRLRTEVKNWVWDTMIATHVFDNRQGITSLKFQVYVQFGVIDYSSEIAPYLKGKEEKNTNSINNIEELISTEEGKQKLMHYCGLDAVFEFRLAKKQQEMLLPYHFKTLL